MIDRLIRFVCAAVLAASCVSVATAQMPPGDPKLGTKLGMQELNNSGQDGDVTLFGRDGGRATLVVVAVEGAPHRAEPIAIHASRSVFCDAIAPARLYPLKDLVNGRSTTLVHVPIMKLLSGHYSVVVARSAAAPTSYASCGSLHL